MSDIVQCVDLFCGVGGLTHGLSRAGIEVVAGYDVDPACRFAYEANNTATFHEQDIRRITASEIAGMFRPGVIRLLAGCAPCQPFSTYSRARRGTRAEEWDLLMEFGRIARELQPDLITMENVPQLVRHPVFERFLCDLDGYDIHYEIVQCADHGIPQTRKRLVLLASKLGPIRLGESLKTPARTTVRMAISRLPPLAAGQAHVLDRLHSACRLSEINLLRVRASKPGGTWRDWPEALRARCHARDTGATYPSVYGRMSWDEPSPTITTQCFGYGNGRFGHPDQDRAITLREAAILQTFPPDYRFLPAKEMPSFHVMGRLIGNAVPVRLGEIIGDSLRSHLQATAENAKKLKAGIAQLHS